MSSRSRVLSPLRRTLSGSSISSTSSSYKQPHVSTTDLILEQVAYHFLGIIFPFACSLGVLFIITGLFISLYLVELSVIKPGITAIITAE